jgi:hypothetical protein
MTRPISEVLAMTMQQADNILNGLTPWAIERLQQGMERYLHLCGVSVCTADAGVLEQDKVKYPHMIKRESGGQPLLSADDCVNFLSDVTGLTPEKSLAFQMRAALKWRIDSVTSAKV